MTTELNRNQILTKLHGQAMDVIGEALIVLQDKTTEIGEMPSRFREWEEEYGAVLWWDTAMTGCEIPNILGEITAPPCYAGSPTSRDWPFEEADEPHLLWVPIPKLVRSRP